MGIPEFIYRRQAVAKSQQRMEAINDYFRSEGRPLDLTEQEYQLFKFFLSRRVAEGEKVQNYYNTRIGLLKKNMGFSDENSYLFNLIYSPLDDIAQLWMESFRQKDDQALQITHEPQSRYLDLPIILQIKQIISQNMQESDKLVHQMRRLENVYHPLQTQLTFK